MAEGVGFEPTVELPLHGISSAAPSATRPPLLHHCDLLSRVADLPYLCTTSICSSDCTRPTTLTVSTWLRHVEDQK